MVFQVEFLNKFGEILQIQLLVLFVSKSMETYFWLLHGLVKNAWDYRWLCSVSLNFHLYLGVDLFVILRGKHIYMRLFPRLSGINSDFEHIVCLCHRTLWVILASCLYRFSLWALQMKHGLWLEVWRRRLSKIWTLLISKDLPMALCYPFWSQL